MSRAGQKKEWKRRLRADATGEAAAAKQEIESVRDKLSDLELMFRTLREITQSERTEEDASDIASWLEDAIGCCESAAESIDSLGESEATTLMKVIQEKFDIDYEERIL